MAADSGRPAVPSTSTGTLPTGLIARKASCLCSPFRILTGTISYFRPSSLSSQITRRARVGGSPYSFIISSSFHNEERYRPAHEVVERDHAKSTPPQLRCERRCALPPPH